MLTKEFRKAINFMEMKFKNVFRKRSGLPYSTHIVRVISILLRSGVYDNVTLCAGVLHDVIEEVGVNLEELRQHFQERIVETIVQLTDSTIDDPKVLKQHKIFLAKYVYSQEAIMISCADKLDNFSDNLDEYSLGLTKFNPDKINYYYGLFRSFEFRLREKYDPSLSKMLEDYKGLLIRFEKEVK